MNSVSNIRALVDRILYSWNWGEGSCKGCPLNLVNKNPGFAYVDPDAEVMVIAQNPGGSGKLERERGSGDLTHKDCFWKDVAEAKEEDYDWLDVLEHMVDGTCYRHLRGIYWTNACKCAYDSERKLSLLTATKHCMQYLVEEIEILLPRLIVSFGKMASKALIEILELPIRYKTMDGLHAEWTRSPKGDLPVLFLKHWGHEKTDEYKKDVNTQFRRMVERIR